MTISNRRIVSCLSLLCAVLSVCASCGNFKNRRVTDENKGTILAEIPTSKDLTGEDRELLGAYVVRYSFSGLLTGGKPGLLPTGKTIGEMIEEQRALNTKNAEVEKEQKAKEQKLAAEIAAKEAGMLEYVTVTLYSLKEDDAGYMPGFEAGIAFKAGSKDIRAFEGNLAVSDVLGNRLGQIPVTVLKPLKANDSGISYYRNLYMAFSDLRGKHLEDIKAKWKPSKIVFADSTELSMAAPTD
jgi:hypothetical protein